MKVELLSLRGYNETASTVTTVRVELTRRNLLTLLEKLDDPLSERTIVKADEDRTCNAWIVAVEDDAHYGPDCPPGLMYRPSSREFH